MCVLVRISVAMIKHHGWKKSFVCLTLLHHTPITEGRQGRNWSGNLETGMDDECMEESCCLVACSSWLARGGWKRVCSSWSWSCRWLWTTLCELRSSGRARRFLTPPWAISPVLLQPLLILYKITCFNKVYFSIFSFVVRAWGLKCKKLLSSLGL